MKIIADANIPHIKDYFASYGELILKDGRAISNQDVIDADILLVRSITRVDQSLLAGSSVKFVGSVTAGSDHLDINYLNEAGIAWHIAKGFNAPPVADYVVSVLAALTRKKILSSTKIKAAVIGVGHVGKLVVDRFKLLGMDVILCDPIRAKQEKNFVSVPFDTLKDLDLISLHVPLSKTGAHPTYHLVGKKFLEKQKKHCVLINASRGAVINSDDLYQYGQHLHWCLDVWEQEPSINKKILEKSCIATPHIAGYSLQSKARGIDMIYQAACKKNIIPKKLMAPFKKPNQILHFSGLQLRWYDIVLGIFNPDLLTSMMQNILLPSKHLGPLFDAMRNEFNYRHELTNTRVIAPHIVFTDRPLLKQLGLFMPHSFP